MTKKVLVGLLLFTGLAVFSQGKLIHTGEISGYVTLKCDFHTHTVFSDGEVWPAFRIREAMNDGLDVLAITDHLEYHPYKDYFAEDDNAAFRVAKNRADRNNLLLIRGTEITREMPPGHFNALFLNDSTVFEDTTFMKVMEKAINQGAFILWNHPGWKGQQPDGVARKYEIHEKLIHDGWVHGVEIYNDSEFYPEVMAWCLQDDLTMIGNSDVHGSTAEVASSRGYDHRVMTLVFAKDRSIKALKDALFAGRTLVWYGDTIAGNLDMAEPFVKSSLKRSSVHHETNKHLYYRIENPTDIPFFLTHGENPGAPKKIKLRPHSYQIIRVKKGGDQTLVYTVSNVKIDARERLKVEL